MTISKPKLTILDQIGCHRNKVFSGDFSPTEFNSFELTGPQGSILCDAEQFEIKSKIWFWNQVDSEVWSGRESQRSGSQSSGSLAGGFSRWNWTCKFSVRDCTTSQLSTMRCGRQSSRTILSTNMAPEPRVETLAWTGCSGQVFMPFAIRSHYATYWPDVEYSRT